MGLQIVEGPLLWACHGELFCELAQIVRPAPVSSSLSGSAIRAVLVSLLITREALRDVDSRTRRCQRRLLRCEFSCNQRQSLTNSFLILGSPHAAVLLLLRSSTLTICTSRHDSTNDSSHHVNVAQYLMWLHDARGSVGPISSARFGLASCFRMQQERSLQVKRDVKALS